MNILELMNAAKKNSNISTDRELARRLKVSHGLPYLWRKGENRPNIDNSHQLAELAGLDPAQVIADVLIQSEKVPEVRKTLERLKSALATAALVVMITWPGVSQAFSNIHYTQWKRIFRSLKIRKPALN